MTSIATGRTDKVRLVCLDEMLRLRMSTCCIIAWTLCGHSNSGNPAIAAIDLFLGGSTCLFCCASPIEQLLECYEPRPGLHMLAKAAELLLKLHSDLVVLTPNILQTRLDPLDSSSTESHGRPRHDTNLKGTVTLHLPKEAKFKRISVELVSIGICVRARYIHPAYVCVLYCQ